jgi:hypothetical protein
MRRVPDQETKFPLGSGVVVLVNAKERSTS